jgi:hypothetical protein
MIRYVDAWFRGALVAAGMMLVTSGSLVAAERGGGLRQVPLLPPNSMKSGSITTPSPSRPDITEPSELPSEVRQLPDSVVIKHRGARYVVSAGRWYEQRGDKLRAITPPQGVLVPELPQGYSMRWVGGVPYFYADGLYYVWRERKHSYEVLPTPPAGDTGQRSDVPATPRPKGVPAGDEAP